MVFDLSSLFYSSWSPAVQSLPYLSGYYLGAIQTITWSGKATPLTPFCKTTISSLNCWGCCWTRWLSLSSGRFSQTSRTLTVELSTDSEGCRQRKLLWVRLYFFFTLLSNQLPLVWFDGTPAGLRSLCVSRVLWCCFPRMACLILLTTLRSGYDYHFHFQQRHLVTQRVSRTRVWRHATWHQYHSCLRDDQPKPTPCRFPHPSPQRQSCLDSKVQ